MTRQLSVNNDKHVNHDHDIQLIKLHEINNTNKCYETSEH